MSASNFNRRTMFPFLTVLVLLISIALSSATIFDYDVRDAEGKTVSLAAYKSAKVILVGE